MSDKEIFAYVAGIFDGEGHLSIEKQSANGKERKHDYYTLRIVIANTNLELIDWLVTKFNGSKQKCKKYEGYKQGYKFLLFGEKLFGFLVNIYPYLIVKKPIADVAFEFRKTVGKTGWYVSKETLAIRHDLYLKAKQINKPGDHHITSSLLP